MDKEYTKATRRSEILILFVIFGSLIGIVVFLGWISYQYLPQDSVMVQNEIRFNNCEPQNIRANVTYNLTFTNGTWSEEWAQVHIPITLVDIYSNGLDQANASKLTVQIQDLICLGRADVALV